MFIFRNLLSTRRNLPIAQTHFITSSTDALGIDKVRTTYRFQTLVYRSYAAMATDPKRYALNRKYLFAYPTMVILIGFQILCFV